MADSNTGSKTKEIKELIAQALISTTSSKFATDLAKNIATAMMAILFF